MMYISVNTVTITVVPLTAGNVSPPVFDLSVNVSGGDRAERKLKVSQAGKTGYFKIVNARNVNTFFLFCFLLTSVASSD